MVRLPNLGIYRSRLKFNEVCFEREYKNFEKAFYVEEIIYEVIVFEQLAVSVGTERVGTAGWIVDKILGSGTDIDEETARLAIADLIERKLIRLTETRRLESTEVGAGLWSKFKPVQLS